MYLIYANIFTSLLLPRLSSRLCYLLFADIIEAKEEILNTMQKLDHNTQHRLCIISEDLRSLQAEVAYLDQCMRASERRMQQTTFVTYRR